MKLRGTLSSNDGASALADWHLPAHQRLYTVLPLHAVWSVRSPTAMAQAGMWRPTG